LLPRMMALADIAWSDTRPRDWTTYAQREGAQYAWLERKKYSFRIPNPSFMLSADAPISYANVSSSPRTISAMMNSAQVTVTIADEVPGVTIRYTLDGSTPTAQSPVYSAPFALTLGPQPRDVTATAFLPDGRVSTLSVLHIERR